MAVPRTRTSNAKKNSRRSHHAKKASNLTACPNCNTPRMAHRLCPHCGHYKGRNVVQSEAEA